MSDRSEDCAGHRELLPGAGDCRGTDDHAGGCECTGPVCFSGGAAPAGGTSHTISSAGKPGGGKGASGRRSPMAATPLSPQGASAHIPLPGTGGPVMVCFPCSRSGHGVGPCSRMDTAFPFLPPGWSVDFRDGQYRAVWPRESPGRSQSGNKDIRAGRHVVLLTLAGAKWPPLQN